MTDLVIVMRDYQEKKNNLEVDFLFSFTAILIYFYIVDVIKFIKRLLKKIAVAAEACNLMGD